MAARRRITDAAVCRSLLVSRERLAISVRPVRDAGSSRGRRGRRAVQCAVQAGGQDREVNPGGRR